MNKKSMRFGTLGMTQKWEDTSINTKKKSIALNGKALAILAAGLLATEASAVPVTEWGFTLDSGFTSTTYTSGINLVQETNTNTYWNAPSTLSWGGFFSGNRSSIDVGGATNGQYSGTVTTDGGAVNTITFTHTNNTIPLTNRSLLSAQLSDRIVLNPLLPNSSYDPNAELNLPSLKFNINFTETLNIFGTCATTSPTPCNDIFVLDIEGAGFNPANNSINQNFSFQDPTSLETHDYNARIFIDGLGILEDSACTAAGVGPGCIGLTTVENQTNAFQVSLDITTKQFFVPEPGILALLGVGLVGMGYRRSKKA